MLNPSLPSAAGAWSVSLASAGDAEAAAAPVYGASGEGRVSWGPGAEWMPDLSESLLWVRTERVKPNEACFWRPGSPVGGGFGWCGSTSSCDDPAAVLSPECQPILPTSSHSLQSLWANLSQQHIPRNPGQPSPGL